MFECCANGKRGKMRLSDEERKVIHWTRFATDNDAAFFSTAKKLCRLEKLYFPSHTFMWTFMLQIRLSRSECYSMWIVQKWLFHFKLFLLSRIIASRMIFCRVESTARWCGDEVLTTFIELHKLKEQIFSANVSSCYRRFLSLELLFALNIWFSNFLSSFGHCYSAGNIFQITLFPGT